MHWQYSSLFCWILPFLSLWIRPLLLLHNKKFARKAKGAILGEMKVLIQLEVNPNLYRLPLSISVHGAENEFQLNCSRSRSSFIYNPTIPFHSIITQFTHLWMRQINVHHCLTDTQHDLIVCVCVCLCVYVSQSQS